MRFVVDRLDHLVITCRDIETMANWYQRVLGMEREAYGLYKRTALRFGGQKINLRGKDETQTDWPTGEAAAPGTQDLCFIVTVPAADIIAHLHSCGVMLEQGPVTKHGALGPMTSVYCRDPDGNLIELSTYQI